MNVEIKTKEEAMRRIAVIFSSGLLITSPSFGDAVELSERFDISVKDLLEMATQESVRVMNQEATLECDLRLLDEEIARCDRALDAAKRAKTEYRIRHCNTNPLPVEFIAAAAARVREGGALCCDAGYEWLSAHVDVIWATVINGWAYEALACCEDRQERREEYSTKVLVELGHANFAGTHARED